MNFTLDGRFTKRCFCCKTVPVGPFGVSCTERRCTNQACSSNKNWRALEQEVLAPILPEWRLPTLDALPGILASESGFAADGSIIWADSEDELPETHKNYICKEFDEGKWNELFPFDKNFLACNGLRCGNPFCYRGKRLQDYSDCKQVYVMDMTGFNWSRTLKDPRMWSCINIAVEKGIRMLWAWTAGNAGLSLARLATAANAFLAPPDRLHVYLFYDGTDTAMQNDVLPLLKAAGGELIPVSNPRGGVYSPSELLSKIRPEIHYKVWGELTSVGAFWDITDGWDGAGSIDYRRLFLQAFLRLQPDYVVMPLGTGNLLIGALLAGEDFFALTEQTAPHCVCGVPYDQNIVRQIGAAPGFKKDPGGKLEQSVKIEPNSSGIVLKWTPKVAGYYSALLACVEHAIQERGVQVFGIGEDRLREAYRSVCAPKQVTQPRHIRSEPSSAVAFAALRNLVSDDRLVANSRVLVVNSGSGIMGADEVAFIRQAFA